MLFNSACCVYSIALICVHQWLSGNHRLETDTDWVCWIVASSIESSGGLCKHGLYIEYYKHRGINVIKYSLSHGLHSKTEQSHDVWMHFYDVSSVTDIQWVIKHMLRFSLFANIDMNGPVADKVAYRGFINIATITALSKSKHSRELASKCSGCWE